MLSVFCCRSIVAEENQIDEVLHFVSWVESMEQHNENSGDSEGIVEPNETVASLSPVRSPGRPWSVHSVHSMFENHTVETKAGT